MTNEQINAAIAEACGWENIRWVLGISGRNFAVGDIPGIAQDIRKEVPDYCHDLNAMHEAEGWLLKRSQDQPTDIEWRMYCAELERTVGVCIAITATARQRAEAFLRTLGKWIES